jgi:transposase
MEKPPPKPDNLSKARIAPNPESTLVCVIEMSRTSWLVAATVPRLDRRPLRKLSVNPMRPLEQARRWRKEACMSNGSWRGACSGGLPPPAVE